MSTLDTAFWLIGIVVFGIFTGLSVPTAVTLQNWMQLGIRSIIGAATWIAVVYVITRQ